MATASLIIAAVGAVVSASYSVVGARQEQKRQEYNADQAVEGAKAVRAGAQRLAFEERRQGDYVASRARAVAGASGAGGIGLTRDISAIEAQGEYNALNALYSGETKARGMEASGQMMEWQGAESLRAGKAQATSTLMSTGGSMGSEMYRGGKK